MGASKLVFLYALAAVLSCSCGGAKGRHAAREYSLGEDVRVGSLSYHVIEAEWKSQLGEGMLSRSPQRNFLLVRLSVTNGGSQSVSVPQLSLENPSGESYSENMEGAGIPNWLGYIRSVAPAQTEEGNLLFDVPTNTYRLKLTDPDDPESKAAWYINIPLTFNPTGPDPLPIPPIPQQ